MDNDGGARSGLSNKLTDVLRTSKSREAFYRFIYRLFTGWIEIEEAKKARIEGKCRIERMATRARIGQRC